MILNINQNFYLTKNTKGEQISLVPRCTFKSMVPLHAFCKKYSADKQIKVNVQIESQQ